MQQQSMESSDLWEFLDQRQRSFIVAEEEEIVKSASFPIPQHKIDEIVSSSQSIKLLQEVDPDAVTLRDRLRSLNQTSFTIKFREMVEVFSQMINKTVESFEDEQTLDYLKSDFRQLVHKTFGREHFELKIKMQKGGSMWYQLSSQVYSIIKESLEDLIKYFGFKDYLLEQEREESMRIFEKMMEKLKIALDRIHVIGKEGAYSIDQKENDNEELANIDSVIKAFEIIEREEEFDINEKIQEKEQKSSFFGNILNSGQQLVGKISGIFIADPKEKIQEQEEGKALKGQILEKRREQQKELKDQEKKFLQKLIYSNSKKLMEMIVGQFTTEEKKRLQFAIKEPLLQWQANQMLIVGSGNVVQANKISLFKTRQSLMTFIDSLPTGVNSALYKMLPLIAMLYRTVQRQYSILLSNYMIKICQNIEKIFIPGCPYLRGALRMLQTSSIKPTDLATRLAYQAPFRSGSFSESKESKYQRQKQFYSETASPDLGILKENEHIRFRKLNYANPTKSVCFLISGFLTDDKQKDLEWRGVNSSLRQTELYGVLWRSSTKTELIKNLAVTAGSIALNIPGLKIPGFVRVAQMGLNIKNKISENKKKESKNVFSDSMERAASAGKELADKIISYFSDRYIILIGFSMGAEVIRNCLQRLLEKRQLKLIKKIVTLGGVVDHEKVEDLLRKSKEPLSWDNFQSKNDYLMRYMYRVCTMGTESIGINGIKDVSGHQIQNYDVSELINGHMEYMSKLDELSLRIGLNHL